MKFSPGRHRRIFKTASAWAVAGLTFALAGCNEQQTKAQPAPPPPSVIVEPVVARDLAEERSFIGRVEAIDKVSLRARIQGYLKSKAFEEGAEVKAGDLLFEIEPEPFRLNVQQAEANLASAQAALNLAQQTFDRAEELLGRGAGTKAALDTARAALLQAQANMKARATETETAKLNLGYTRITAPMDGRVGRAAFSVGNLVGPDSGALLLLVRQDPVYITFPIPNWLLLQVRKEGRDGESYVVRLRLADDSLFQPEGQIEFIDVQATASTDSVTVRAKMPNPKRTLIDQQLVNVLVIPRKPDRKIMMQQSALLLDQQGAYVLALDEKNAVQIRRIKTGQQNGSMIVVEDGLAPGVRVVTSGHQKARPGIVVAPQSPAATPATAKPDATPDATPGAAAPAPDKK